jgi:NTE family protein
VEAEIRRALTPLLEKPVRPEEVAEHLLAIAGSDRYEYLTYSVTQNPRPTALHVGVAQKKYGPPFLMLGLDLNNIDSTNFAFNLAGRVLDYGHAGAGSELRFDFVFGTTQRLAGEILKPFGSTPVFVAPRAWFDRRGRNAYLDDVFVAEYRIQRTGAGIDVGVDIGRTAEARVGFDVADIQGRRRVGSPDLPDVDGSERYAHIDFILDSQTSPLVPTRGFRVQSTLRRYFAAPRASGPIAGVIPDSPQSFVTGEVRMSWFSRTRHRADRLFVSAEAGSAFGAHPLVNDFSLGGPLRLGAFNNDQLRGDNYLLGVGGYLRGVGHLPEVLGGGIFLGTWIEAGSAFDVWKRQDWHSDGSAGVILETLLGPVFVGGSVGFTGGSRIYIALGPLVR